ncbi:hypothetical protein [Archangium sp.]|uniref:hypothetical protein n=1 Tax=Archangium sp. TaxID=1872627 RepID=UPI002D643405|nr:hypothetical protein [Archangium sp.]HYO57400.1 hypothetical protein [Archangium sp.]
MSGPASHSIFDFNTGAFAKSLLLTGPTTETPRFAMILDATGGEQQATSADPFPVGALTHVAVTIDSPDRLGVALADWVRKVK